eukprot:362349-Chlamydomonas_euryale.AAC.7
MRALPWWLPHWLPAAKAQGGARGEDALPCGLSHWLPAAKAQGSASGDGALQLIRTILQGVCAALDQEDPAFFGLRCMHSILFSCMHA